MLSLLTILYFIILALLSIFGIYRLLLVMMAKRQLSLPDDAPPKNTPSIDSASAL